MLYVDVISRRNKAKVIEQCIKSNFGDKPLSYTPLFSRGSKFSSYPVDFPKPVYKPYLEHKIIQYGADVRM